MTESMVKYPKITGEYDHVPSHVKVMNSGIGRSKERSRILVQEASEHLMKLSMMAQHLDAGEIQALQEKFPAVSQHWVDELAQPSIASSGGSSTPRLPPVHGAQPSPRRQGQRRGAPQPQQPNRGAKPPQGRPSRGRKIQYSQPSPRPGLHPATTIVEARAEAHGSQAFEGHRFNAEDSTLRWLEGAQQPPRFVPHPPAGARGPAIDVSADTAPPPLTSIRPEASTSMPPELASTAIAPESLLLDATETTPAASTSMPPSAPVACSEMASAPVPEDRT